MSGLVNQEDKVRVFDAYNIRCKWNMVELENSKIVKELSSNRGSLALMAIMQGNDAKHGYENSFRYISGLYYLIQFLLLL